LAILEKIYKRWDGIKRGVESNSAVDTEFINSQHLTDKEMEILITRLTPSLCDVVLDGVDDSKTDFFRKLRIIINDIITTKQKGNNVKSTEVNRSYAQQLVDEYFDNYKTEKPSESDLPMILSIVEFMLKKFYYVAGESKQATSKFVTPKYSELAQMVCDTENQPHQYVGDIEGFEKILKDNLVKSLIYLRLFKRYSRCEITCF